MRDLKLVPANDTFGVLLALTAALEDGPALMVTDPEINGQKPNWSAPQQVAPDVAAVVRSSGSTGIPKDISISASALLASARATERRIGSGQWLLALPTNFIAGLQVLTRSIVGDTQPVLLNTQVPFTAEGFVRGASLMEEGIRFTSLVPAQLHKLEQAIDDPMVYSALRKFEAILVGGQRPNWSTIANLRGMGINLITTYGMTESSGGCVYDGVALEGVEFRVVADQVQLRGKVMAEGISDWFETNDLGVITDGKLEVLGRSDRVVISGGKKVSLERVEELVSAMPGISEVVAVSVVDSTWGERVAIGFEGSPEVTELISTQLLQTIGTHAKPIAIRQFLELPRLQSGKPDLQTITELLGS